MEKKKTLATVLGIGAGLAGALAGCKTPERIGYENTFIGEDNGFIAACIDYPNLWGRGRVNKVEFYGDSGELLHTDNLTNMFFSNGGPRGHRSVMKRPYTGEEITVRVTDRKGNSFTKKFENPTKE